MVYIGNIWGNEPETEARALLHSLWLVLDGGVGDWLRCSPLFNPPELRSSERWSLVVGTENDRCVLNNALAPPIPPAPLLPTQESCCCWGGFNGCLCCLAIAMAFWSSRSHDVWRLPVGGVCGAIKLAGCGELPLLPPQPDGTAKWVVLELEHEEIGLFKVEPWMLDKALWLADVWRTAVLALL